MAAFEMVMSVASAMRGWLGTLSAERTRKTIDVREAVKAVGLAASSSKAYLAGLARGEPVNRQRELELSTLWIEATGALYKVDDLLAQRCFMKADYWSDRDAWTRRDLWRHQLMLSQIARRARRLLGE